MLSHFLTLEIMPGATDEEIRKAYLKQVRQYTPEKYPEQFQRVNTAYEAVKDQRNRIKLRLFTANQSGHSDEELFALAKAREIKRRRASMKELLEACRKK